jgi:hypothetical protein
MGDVLNLGLPGLPAPKEPAKQSLRLVPGSNQQGQIQLGLDRFCLGQSGEAQAVFSRKEAFFAENCIPADCSSFVRGSVI